jgi:hypothetical protein
MSQPTGQPNQPIGATRPAEADDRERRPTAVAGRGSTRAAGDDPLATATEASRPGVLLCLLLALDGFVVLAFQPSVPARVTVPYSSFVSQTHQSNVALVTRQG